MAVSAGADHWHGCLAAPALNTFAADPPRLAAPQSGAQSPWAAVAVDPRRPSITLGRGSDAHSVLRMPARRARRSTVRMGPARDRLRTALARAVGAGRR